MSTSSISPPQRSATVKSSEVSGSTYSHMLVRAKIEEELGHLKKRKSPQSRPSDRVDSGRIFRRRIPIYNSSRMIRRPATQDVRLTPSDKIHNLIMANAQEAFDKIRAEKAAKSKKTKKKKHKEVSKESLKEVDKVDKVNSPKFVLTPKISPEPYRLPKLGIPALDSSAESLATKESEVLAITYEEVPPPSPEVVPKSGSSSRTVPRFSTIAKAAEHELGKIPEGKKMLEKERLEKKSSSKTEPQYPQDQPEAIAKVKPKGLAKARKRKVAPMEVMKEKSEDRVSSRVELAEKKLPPEHALSLVHVHRGPPTPTESWINTVWTEEVEKRLMEDATSDTDTTVTRTPTDVQQRLQDIRKHLRTHRGGEYHPYANRRNAYGVSNCGAIALLVKALVASGALRMPLPYGYIGHYNAVIPTVLILLWISGTLHIYIHSRQNICKKLRRPYLSFSETIEEAFRLGPKWMHCFSYWFGKVVNVTMVYHQFTILMKYCIFMGRYAILTFDTWEGGTCSSIYLMPFMITCVLILWVRSLKTLVIISVMGNLLACIHYGIVLFQLTGELVAHEEPHTAFGIVPMISYLYFLGHMLCLIDCIAAFLVVEAQMRHPRLITGYSGIFNLALVFSGLWYIMIGFFGIRQFGDNIALDYLKDLDLQKPTYYFLFAAYCIVILGAFAVQSFISIQILWEYCRKTSIKKSEYRRSWKYLLRTTYAVMPFLYIYQPQIVVYALMIMGYIAGPFLMLLCPVLVHFCWCWSERQQMINKLKILGDLILAALAIFGIVTIVLWFITKYEYRHVVG